MNKGFKIHFHLKKPKNYTGGNMTIYMRLTVGGQRVEISTQRGCDPIRWSKQSERVIGKKEDITRLNNHLESLLSKVYIAEKELSVKGETVTAASIRNWIIGKEGKTVTILSIYTEHNKQFEALVEIGEFAIGTQKKFQTAFNSLRSFIKWKYKASDWPISKISYQFIADYEFYLKTIQRNGHNTAMSQIKKLKKIVRISVANGWIETDPFKSFKITTADTQRNYLMDYELKNISEKQFDNRRLNLVKDIFVFSCYTGLSYSDVARLSLHDLDKGVDGKLWIFTSRIKTGTASRIPLLPEALNIINKYKSDLKVLSTGLILPILSNQKMNAYIKEIADCTGIKKELTFHCARHTFATTVTLTNGVPIETVGKMLGHKSLRTTQIYAKIVDSKVSEDMQELSKRLAKKTIQ